MGYQLPNEWSQARRRLELLGATFDPKTIARLEQIGVGAGWRCFEVGGGSGSITRWLCERTGRNGHVVTVDLDTRYLEAIDAPNIYVRRSDVVRDSLPDGEFDLVHTRFLLAHLPTREDVLLRLAGRLAAKGWLVVEELDWFSTSILGEGAWAEATRWYARVMTAAGADMEWGRHLGSRLTAIGLVDVEASGTVDFFPGGSPWAELMILTITQLWDRMRTAGCPQNVLADFTEALADPAKRFPGFVHVGAQGRRDT
jgi:SAM-dependent methyltransferase